MSVVTASIDAIAVKAHEHEAVLVALSFGKDSLVVLDLCCKHFKRVEAFTMTYAGGMPLVRRSIAEVRERWGVNVAEYEHWGAMQARHGGYRCRSRVDGVRPQRLTDTFTQVAKDFAIPLVATGARKAESIGRRSAINRGTWPGWHPIADWKRQDVIDYLSVNGIPLPDAERSDMAGVALDQDAILWLHDRHPQDYELLAKEFEFVPAVVKRREWYGIGKEYSIA